MRDAVCSFALLAAIAACSLQAAPAAAQSQVYVQAFDQRTGSIVTDLRKAEVLVRVDGVVRPVLDVRPANVPAKLVVLVDNSGTAVRALRRTRDGLQSFLARLPPHQEVSLLSLSPRPRWVVQGAIDAEEIRAGVDGLEMGGRSLRLLDGLVEASEWIAADTGPHRPVILIVSTTGRDQSEDRAEKFEALADRVNRYRITVHAVVMRTARSRTSFPRNVSAAEVIGRDLSEFTAGSFALVVLGARLDRPLGDVAGRILSRNRELAQQHLVRYEPGAGDGLARVRVDIARFGVKFVVTVDGKRVE